MPSFSGTIQIAKIPAGAAESFYDVAAGVCATSATISGFTNVVTANHNIAWDKGGPYENDTNLLIFALPHHPESFDGTTKTLQSPQPAAELHWQQGSWYHVLRTRLTTTHTSEATWNTCKDDAYQDSWAFLY